MRAWSLAGRPSVKPPVGRNAVAHTRCVVTCHLGAKGRRRRPDAERRPQPLAAPRGGVLAWRPLVWDACTPQRRRIPGVGSKATAPQVSQTQSM